MQVQQDVEHALPPLDVPVPELALQPVRGDRPVEEELVDVDLRQVVGVRAQHVREPAQLLVAEHQGDERQEVEDVAPRDAEHQGGHEQDQEVAILAQVEALEPDHAEQPEEVAADQERRALPCKRMVSK